MRDIRLLAMHCFAVASIWLAHHVQVGTGLLHNNHENGPFVGRTPSSLVHRSRAAYTWLKMYEDPALQKAWSYIDRATLDKLDHLLYERPVEANGSLPATSAASATSTNSEDTATKTTTGQPSKQTKSQEERIKELEDTIKNITGNAGFNNGANEQRCDFGKLTSETWRDSKAPDLLKQELNEFRTNGSNTAFYVYLFNKYAPGLASSQTYCNGRGHCSVSIISQM